MLRRSLAADLIQAGSGRSLLTPPARHSQEPGTAISMSAPTVTRRNNLNSSLQVQADNRTVEELRLQAQLDNRTVDELRDELHRFGEACQATLEESLQSEAQARSDLARVQRATANVVILHKQQEQERAACRLALEERANELMIEIVCASCRDRV